MTPPFARTPRLGLTYSIDYVPLKAALIYDPEPLISRIKKYNMYVDITVLCLGILSSSKVFSTMVIR